MSHFACERRWRVGRKEGGVKALPSHCCSSPKQHILNFYISEARVLSSPRDGNLLLPPAMVMTLCLPDVETLQEAGDCALCRLLNDRLQWWVACRHRQSALIHSLSQGQPQKTKHIQEKLRALVCEWSRLRLGLVLPFKGSRIGNGKHISFGCRQPWFWGFAIY